MSHKISHLKNQRNVSHFLKNLRNVSHLKKKVREIYLILKKKSGKFITFLKKCLCLCVVSPQSQQESAYICVHHGLPHRALPSAHLRALLQADDSPMHGGGNQMLRHVSGRQPQRVRSGCWRRSIPPTVFPIR